MWGNRIPRRARLASEQVALSPSKVWGAWSGKMSLAGYFRNVGAALLALLWIADFYLPRPDVVRSAVVDQPAIRIHSDQKWPERVVFDTSTPVVSTTLAASDRNIEASLAAAALPASSALATKPGDAFAMLPRTESSGSESARSDQKQSKVAARPARKKTRPHFSPFSPDRQFAWYGFRPWVIESPGRQRWN